MRPVKVLILPFQGNLFTSTAPAWCKCGAFATEVQRSVHAQSCIHNYSVMEGTHTRTRRTIVGLQYIGRWRFVVCFPASRKLNLSMQRLVLVSLEGGLLSGIFFMGKSHRKRCPLVP